MRLPARFSPELLRHVPRKPATVMYPFVPVEAPEGFRGKHEFDIEKCVGCGLCARDCPSGAIEMVPDERTKGKKRPVIHLDRCLFCAQCEESCPRGAIKLTKVYEMAGYKREEMVVTAP
ncbi:MAG: NuoI/complex I 23 kDa subunit family protein [Candidatus Baldrarchaeia archaeon]